MSRAPTAADRRPIVRQAMRDDDGRRIEVDVDLAESPLAWLASRRDRDGSAMIAPEELMAGDRLRRDFSRAGLIARSTMNWEGLATGAGLRGSGGGGGGGGRADSIGDHAIDARRRLQAALSAIGPDLSAVAVDVCCHLRGLADVERAHGWPARSGKVVLRLALAALARHYGYGGAAPVRRPVPPPPS